MRLFEGRKILKATFITVKATFITVKGNFYYGEKQLLLRSVDNSKATFITVCG
jgi:hypothetical protein